MAIDEKKKTAGDLVYDYLHSNIIGLRLKPGQAVNINDLSKHLNVSRSPVRDALIRLEKESLVISLPQRGTLISKIDCQRASNERFVRVCVEEKVFAEFIDIAREEDITVLEKNIRLQKEAEQKADVRLFLELDDAFHKYLYIRTEKGLCYNMIQNNVGHYNRIRLLSCMEKNMLSNTIAQHEVIIHHIRTKNKPAMEEYVRKHLAKIELDEVELKLRYPDLFVDAALPESAPANVWEDDFLSGITDR